MQPGRCSRLSDIGHTLRCGLTQGQRHHFLERPTGGGLWIATQRQMRPYIPFGHLSRRNSHHLVVSLDPSTTLAVQESREYDSNPRGNTGRIEGKLMLISDRWSISFSRKVARRLKCQSSARVRTQFAQHLIAKSCTIDKKLRAFFSNLVASLRISFILQKKRSTIFLCA